MAIRTIFECDRCGWQDYTNAIGIRTYGYYSINPHGDSQIHSDTRIDLCSRCQFELGLRHNIHEYTHNGSAKKSCPDIDENEMPNRFLKYLLEG